MLCQQVGIADVVNGAVHEILGDVPSGEGLSKYSLMKLPYHVVIDHNNGSIGESLSCPICLQVQAPHHIYWESNPSTIPFILK